jgi:hypothetical protein
MECYFLALLSQHHSGNINAYLGRVRVRHLVVRVLGHEAIDGTRQVHVTVLHGSALAAVLMNPGTGWRIANKWGTCT